MNDRSLQLPEDWFLLQHRRRGEARDQALARLRLSCSCCRHPFEPDRLTRQVCPDCAGHVECAFCFHPFRPSSVTFGLFCQACWPYLRSLAIGLRRDDPGVARRELRRQVRRSQRPRFPCERRAAVASGPSAHASP